MDRRTGGRTDSPWLWQRTALQAMRTRCKNIVRQHYLYRSSINLQKSITWALITDKEGDSAVALFTVQFVICRTLNHTTRTPDIDYWYVFFKSVRNVCLRLLQRETADMSVCLSVTFRCFVQMNKDIWRSSVHGRTIILVSEEIKFIRIFAGVTPSEGVMIKRPTVASENLTNNQPYLGNDAR